MSGDVQPRKRKDKRRKKADGEYTIQRIRGASCDEEDTGTPPPTLVNPSENVENVAIHIHKESSTGGHWCARIIFFTLSAILIGLIGIIIFEYRGATDVDTPIASSQWAMIFDGWVDDVSFLHNEEHADQEAQSGEHEGDEDEKSNGEEDHDEGLGDEERSHEEDEDGEEEEDDEETDQDSVEEDEAETFNSPEEGEMLGDSEENQGLDNDEGYEDNFEETDELGVLEEDENASEEEDSNDNEEEIFNDSGSELDQSLEGVKASEEKFDDETLDEFLEIPGVNEIDNSDGPLEEIDEEEPEEVLNDVDESEEKEEEKEEEASSVAVKFGVGVALVVAAHFVLVRRWNNGDADIPQNLVGIEELPDLSRRNTIVPPPHINKISSKQSTQEPPSKKQTQNYEDLRAKYKTLGSDEALDKMAVKKVLDLQVEKLIKPKEDSNIQSEAKSTSEEEDYTETSEGEQITDSDELEDGDEEDEEEEEDEEIEEIDDSELVAKLEAKYGKLPTPTESEGDDEEEEDEEDDEEEGQDKDIKGWKHVKATDEAEAGATQKAQMVLDTKFSSTAVPETSNFANVSITADLITSEELRNPHLQGPDN